MRSGLLMKLSLAGAAVIAVVAGCSHTSSSTINQASDMASDAGMAMADAGMSSANSMGSSTGASMGSMADAGMSSASSMGSSMGSMADAGMASASGTAMTAADQAKASAGSMANSAGSTGSSMANSAGSTAGDAADAGMGAAASAAAATTGMSDAQIAGITAAAHKGEIDAAKMAKKQSKNAKVKKFAAMMSKQHTAAQKAETAAETKAGITPAESDMSAKITQMNSDTASQLKDLKGKEFDKAYAKAMVDGHTKVLDSLDNVLIPAAKDAGLKAQLQKERPVVAEHLEHAKKLADSVGASQ
jgi:putative membrane protein